MGGMREDGCACILRPASHLHLYTDAMLSPHLTSLRCLRCGAEHEPSAIAYTCPACRDRIADDPGILDARYDDASVGPSLRRSLADGRRTGVFRWAPLLPVEQPSGSMSAGGTPLVSAPRL